MAPVTRRSNGIRKPSKTKSKDVLVELNEKHNKKCMLCGRKDICEKKYGILYQLNDVVVHYFCILLSSKAVQSGLDGEGIWGFLLKDIKSEIKRGSKEACVYCKKMGATISCCGYKCRKIFHFPCALQNGSMHQFFQTFKSYCQQHRITQAIDLNELQKSTPVQCAICKDNVIPTPLPNSLWAPCCKRNAWFHRDCIQDLALSAGYFFKCPLCNNVEKFKYRMLTLGIYIPSRDASWETVPNAYAELLERHSTCNVETCVCPHEQKRNFNQETGSWEIILCHTCGSSGTHRLCSSLKCEEDWYCSACLEITNGTNTKTIKKRKLEISNDTSTTNEISSTQNINLRRSREVKETLRNMGTRGSVRLNNNKNARRNESSLKILQPQQMDEVIVISDDSDNDSDVQCITYIDRPKTVLSQSPQSSRMPIITSYASITNYDSITTSAAPPLFNQVMTFSNPVVNGFQHGLGTSSSQPRNYNNVSGPRNSYAIIDLTSDDEELL